MFGVLIALLKELATFAAASLPRHQSTGRVYILH